MIPSSRGDVRVELADGSICVWEPDGEQYCDGWATVEEIARRLVERVHLDLDEAQSVANEAVRQWEEWLGRRRHRFPVDRPNLTPEQEQLRKAAVRPLSLALLAILGVEVTAVIGALWNARFYWLTAAAMLLLVLAVVRIISIRRRLRQTGPPFADLRWWWPRAM